MDSLLALIGPAIFIAIVAIWFFTAAVKIVQEYERGVVFRLGRLVGARGPGLILLIPKIERMIKVDLRVITLDVPAQEAITRDNVTVKVNAVAYFRVVDSSRAVVTVLDYRRATSLIAQTTLRSVLGQFELDSLLTERDRVNQELQRIIDEQTEAWGIKVTSVEVRDVELPDTMKRAMARQAEAEREKRAKIIHAEGEFAAAERLAEAAGIITSESAGLQLRYLQTLSQIANDRRSTIVFPLPIDLTRGLTGLDGLTNGTGHDDRGGHAGGNGHHSSPDRGGTERARGDDGDQGSGYAPRSGTASSGAVDPTRGGDAGRSTDDDAPTQAFRQPLIRPDEGDRA
ncbi:MAG: slipin family protein [Chloroflexi bacterium]|nr:slipin family protein [Chloroflexota bacterium]